MIKIKRRKKRKEKVFYHVEVKRNIKNAKNWKTLLGSVRKSKSRARAFGKIFVKEGGYRYGKYYHGRRYRRKKYKFRIKGV